MQALADYLDKNYSEEEKNALKSPKYFYEVEFEKPGGLIMPIIENFNLKMEQVKHKFPAQIWRRNNETAKKEFLLQRKKVVKFN